jgi:drug/metabolite transporter (DMT)-like permease
MSRARLFGLAAVAFWSTAATAFKLSLRFCGPYQLVLLSSIVSLVFLLSVLAISGRFRLLLDRGVLVGGALRGFLNPFVYYLVLLEAYYRIPAQIAMVINYLWPVMLVLLSVPLLHQALRSRDVTGMLLSFGGVAVLAFGGISRGGARPETAGLALALASTLIWALYWILNMRAAGDPVARLASNFIWGVALLAGWGLVTGKLGGLDWRTGALAGALWVGLFEMGLTYVIWLRALSLARSSAEVGSLIYITPFASLAFIAIVAREPLQAATFAGLILVVAGLRVQGRT